MGDLRCAGVLKAALAALLALGGCASSDTTTYPASLGCITVTLSTAAPTVSDGTPPAQPRLTVSTTPPGSGPSEAGVLVSTARSGRIPTKRPASPSPGA